MSLLGRHRRLVRRPAPPAGRSWPSPRSSSWSSWLAALRAEIRAPTPAGRPSSRRIGEGLDRRPPRGRVRRSRWARSGSSCGSSATTRSTAARSRAHLLARARAEPARPGARRAAPVLMALSTTSSASPASTTTPRPPCCTTASWSPPARRSASRARSTTPTSPKRAVQYVLARGRHRARRSSTTSASTTSRCSSSSACSSTYVATFPRSFPSFRKAMPVWLKEKLWVPSIIREGAQALQGADLLRRASHEPRGVVLPALALRGGGDPDRRRRRRVGHRHLRRRARQRHHALQGDPLPALPRPALQRLHLLPRLQGQQRRVQGDGPGAVREARALRPDHEGHGPPERRRLVQARHEVLLVRLRPHA